MGPTSKALWVLGPTKDPTFPFQISPELLIVSTNGLVIMDHRTLTLKHRALVGDLVKISVSPYADSVAVLHFKGVSPTW